MSPDPFSFSVANVTNHSHASLAYFWAMMGVTIAICVIAPQVRKRRRETEFTRLLSAKSRQWGSIVLHFKNSTAAFESASATLHRRKADVVFTSTNDQRLDLIRILAHTADGALVAGWEYRDGSNFVLTKRSAIPTAELDELTNAAEDFAKVFLSSLNS